MWRLGWLYLDSPLRLCVQYGLDDQRRLGYALIGLGTVYAIGLATMALAGDGRPVQSSGQRLPP